MLKSLSHFLFSTLRGRLILGVAMVHALMMTLFVVDLTVRQRAMLLDRQIEEATYLSNVLAISAAGWISAGDISGLQELVDAQRSYPEILFAILTDKEGRVLADMDISRLGSYMVDLPGQLSRTVISNTPAAVDIAVPAMVGKHHVGWVRIGLGQKAAGERLAQITRDGISYAFAAILIGSAIAWLMGYRITRRLYAVKATMDEVRSGNGLARSRVVGTDEAAVMAREFNSMLDALAERDAELRDSEEQAQAIFETASIGMAQGDPGTGRFLRVNRKMCEITGYTHVELQAVSFSEITHPEDRERESKFFEDLMDGRSQSVHFEMRALRRDASEVWVSVHVTAIRDSRGSPLLIVAAVEDISMRKRAEEEREKLEAQLRDSQKIEAIGTLAGGIAHDFNNILSPIIGYTEMALDEAQGSGILKQNLEQVLTAALRARDLVRQILAFSRKAGDQSMSLVEVSSIVKEALKLLHATLPPSVEIRQNIEKGVVLADATQIHQVVVNLCANAVHAMDGKGLLQVSLARVDLEHLDPAMDGIPVKLIEGSYLKLSVSDTGKGMDGDTLRRIFEPYFTTKEVDKGTGLGLAVVHGIIARHGGEIVVQSEPGKGCVFDVYLPRLGIKLPASRPDLASSLGGSESILLVDDERMIADMGASMLRQLGYRVTAETSPAEALELFLKDPQGFDLILTDYSMPGLTGIDLARGAFEVRPGMPIILFTGNGTEAMDEAARAAGLRFFFVKPFERRPLAGLIRRVLDGRAPDLSVGPETVTEFEDNGEKEEALKVAFDTMPSLVFVVDEDVRIQEYNAAASELLKADRRTVLKQRAGDILHCIHSRESHEGCGRSEYCRTCPIRNSVMEALQGNQVVRRHARLELFRDGNSLGFDALITASPFSFQSRSVVLLVIEDMAHLS